LIFALKPRIVAPMKRFLLLTLLWGTTACTLTSPSARALIGADEASVRWRFGEPAVIRTESPNTLWAYRDEACSRLIFFDDTGTVRWADFAGTCE